jgi:hypothetical protein
MKKLISLLIPLFATLSAHAAPFLVCDPYPKATSSLQAVSKFTVTGLGASAITVPATVNSDGTQVLHYDLSALPNGTYTVTAAAVNGFGGSAVSAPFTFTSGIPSTPTNISLSAQ